MKYAAKLKAAVLYFTILLALNAADEVLISLEFSDYLLMSVSFVLSELILEYRKPDFRKLYLKYVIIIYLIILANLLFFDLKEILAFFGREASEAFPSGLLIYVLTFILAGLKKYNKGLLLILIIIYTLLLAYFKNDVLKPVLMLGGGLYLYIDPENKKRLIITSLAIVCMVLFGLVLRVEENYDIFANIDRYTLSHIESTYPCPKRIRHILGLCSCEDRGLFKNDGTINDQLFSGFSEFTYLEPGIGDGHISNASLGDGSHTKAYTITSSKRFNYLRSYSASIYDEREHQFLYDSSYIQDVLINYGLNSSLYYDSSLSSANAEKITLEIFNSDNVWSVPYGVNDISSSYVHDSYYVRRGEKATAFFYDPDRSCNKEALDVYASMVVPYLYLDIPSDLKATLLEFMEDNGINIHSNDKEYLINAIADLLKNDYRYSKTIDVIEDDDPILNFLLHSKKGYCVHFAGSATLLMRALDIPSRFVSGYYVSDWNGNIATVYDDDAHAWVEFFDESEGWQMLEVTSGYRGNVDVDIADDPLEDIVEMPQDDDDIEEPEINSPNEDDETTDEPSLNEDVVIKDDDEKADVLKDVFRIAAMLIISVAVLLGIVIAFVLYRRNLPLKKKMIYIYEVLLKYDYLSEDVIEVMEKMRFSNHEVTKSDYLIMHKRQKELIKDKLKSLSFYKKIWLFIRYNVYAF